MAGLAAPARAASSASAPPSEWTIGLSSRPGAARSNDAAACCFAPPGAGCSSTARRESPVESLTPRNLRFRGDPESPAPASWDLRVPTRSGPTPWYSPPAASRVTPICSRRSSARPLIPCSSAPTRGASATASGSAAQWERLQPLPGRLLRSPGAEPPPRLGRRPAAGGRLARADTLDELLDAVAGWGVVRQGLSETLECWAAEAPSPDAPRRLPLEPPARAAVLRAGSAADHNVPLRRSRGERRRAGARP